MQYVKILKQSTNPWKKNGGWGREADIGHVISNRVLKISNSSEAKAKKQTNKQTKMIPNQIRNSWLIWRSGTYIAEQLNKRRKRKKHKAKKHSSEPVGLFVYYIHSSGK